MAVNVNEGFKNVDNDEVVNDNMCLNKSDRDTYEQNRVRGGEHRAMMPSVGPIVPAVAENILKR